MSEGSASNNQSSDSRSARVTGVDLVKAARPGWPLPSPKSPPAPPGLRAGEVRPQTTSPSRHNRSNAVGLKSVRRAFNTSSSIAPAADSNPCNSSITANRPPSPDSRQARSACCHWVRKRINDAAGTGSTWARRDVTVDRWMRASMRRSQNSWPPSLPLNSPLSTAPSASRRASA